MNNQLEVPLDESEIINVVNSIYRYETLPEFSTHIDFAKLALSNFGDKIIYCDDGFFYIYNGQKWIQDSENLYITEYLRELTHKLLSQVESMRGDFSDEDYEKLIKAVKKLQNHNFIIASIKILKSYSEIKICKSDLDSEKHLINLQNGTFNLKTKKLQSFEPRDYLTSQLNFAYDENADCPRFKKFLSEILDEQSKEFILRAFGYTLLGHGREQKFFILSGTGSNGKSTLLEIVKEIFGDLYVALQPESLNGKLSGHVRNDLARLAGKNIMVTSELNSGTVFDAPLIKQITGQDTITARYLQKEYFDFVPCCVPIIITNYLPVIDGSDNALLRRAIVINFDRVIKNPDKNLFKKLKSELSGIFNLLLSSIDDYKKNGLNVPKNISDNTVNFMDSRNLIKQFFEEDFCYSNDDSIMVSSLYRNYSEWCRANGYKPMSNNMFKEHFSRYTKLTTTRKSGGLYWMGIKYKTFS